MVVTGDATGRPARFEQVRWEGWLKRIGSPTSFGQDRGHGEDRRKQEWSVVSGNRWVGPRPQQPSTIQVGKPKAEA